MGGTGTSKTKFTYALIPTFSPRRRGSRWERGVDRWVKSGGGKGSCAVESDAVKREKTRGVYGIAYTACQENGARRNDVSQPKLRAVRRTRDDDLVADLQMVPIGDVRVGFFRLLEGDGFQSLLFETLIIRLENGG